MVDVKDGRFVDEVLGVAFAFVRLYVYVVIVVLEFCIYSVVSVV